MARAKMKTRKMLFDMKSNRSLPICSEEKTR
jgi:hypothetical protein